MGSHIHQKLYIGDVIYIKFLKPNNLTTTSLARALKVPTTRIHEILNGKRTITADSDLRLCKFFSLPEGSFLSMQHKHDLAMAKKRLQPILAEIELFSNHKKY